MSDRRDVCFVVMPFGEKPIPDSGGAKYDFEKVYRVLLSPAIRRAGLEPMRADEISGSHLIHTDMFEHLRDRSVVLVDLSLANPNVYYELGVRHVMASRGTVLTSRTETELPFDIALSRVIFYEFDGHSLDWEETERVLEELRLAIEDAAEQKPDSPVHALLEQVLPAHELSRFGVNTAPDTSPHPDHALNHYQALVAEKWSDEGRDPAALLDDEGTSVFGCRSLGHLCLLPAELPDAARNVAQRLYGHGQSDLVNAIYERLGDDLDFAELLRYGSSLSEEKADLEGAEEGLKKVRQALADAHDRLEAGSPPPDALIDTFTAQGKVAGLLAWRWELSQKGEDLETAIEALQEADGYARRLLDDAGLSQIGRAAQVRLRLLLLLRTHAGDPDRPDTERLRDSILGLEPRPGDPPEEVSYLHWYQAIAWADAGEGERSRELALRTFAEDSSLALQSEDERIGRLQYSNLRRFIGHYADVLQHPVLVARVSQVLQLDHGQHQTGSGHSPGRVAL